jgi:polyisoprenoid-binding protein YceI
VDRPVNPEVIMTRRFLRVAGAALAVATLSGTAAAQSTARPASATPDTRTKWVVDPVHSQVEFGIRHLMGRVRGSFTRWYGVIVTNDREWKHGTVTVQVQTASINTGNSYRDTDLRSPHFLATDSFPAMTFESTGIVATDSTVEISGILTLRGHFHPVVLKGRFNGIGRDKEGHERIGFDTATTVDRRDYGISWNEMVEGSRMIGDDVEISISLEAVRVG